MKREKLHQSRKIFIYGVSGLIVVFLFYGLLIEPYRIEVTHVKIQGTALSHALRDKTAVQLSDLHINKVGKRERKILVLLEDLKPDLIFLTGDYVKWKGNYEEALSFLSRLDAPLGVWAVMGEYDYSSPKHSCLFCHEKGTGYITRRHKVRFLRNELERANLLTGTACIGGIESDTEINHILNDKKCFSGEKPATLILIHDPLVFDVIDKNHDVFMLAGDTHGGQIPIPRWLWNILGYKSNARYNRGLFHEGNKAMYVSRGIGTSHFPIRFLCPPELVVLHF